MAHAINQFDDDPDGDHKEWINTQKKWLDSMTAEQRKEFSPYRTDLLEHIVETIGVDAYNKLPKHPNKWARARAEKLIKAGMLKGMNI